MMFEQKFLEKIIDVMRSTDVQQIRDIAYSIRAIRENNGRLFVLGVGGSAANASHAVNDFRKLLGVEAYSPSDNISELTARINDEGWSSSYLKWLDVNNLTAHDGVLLLSVGGGSIVRNLSMNLVFAAKHAKQKRASVLSIVGRDGGELLKISDYSILVPDLYPELVTPITEAMQSVLLHLIVSHPTFDGNKPTW